MKVFICAYSAVIISLFYRIGYIRGKESYRREMRKRIEEVESRLKNGM